MSPRSVKLLITSPPYNDVADYWNDQWIRLWLLGADMRKDWKRTQKHSNVGEYRALIGEVFKRATRHLRDDGVVVVRCGEKAGTADTCRQAIQAAWPSFATFERRTEVRRRGVASGYGHGAKVVCERDIVAAPNQLADRARAWAGELCT